MQSPQAPMGGQAPDFLMNLLKALFGQQLGQPGGGPPVSMPGGSGFQERGPQMGGPMMGGLVSTPPAPPPMAMGGQPGEPPPIGMDGGLMDRTGGAGHGGSPYGNFHRRQPKVGGY